MIGAKGYNGLNGAMVLLCSMPLKFKYSMPLKFKYTALSFLYHNLYSVMKAMALFS